MHESTKLMRVAQAFPKETPQNKKELHDSFSWVVQSLTSAIRQACVSKDDLKVQWLVGEREAIQALFKRRKFGVTSSSGCVRTCSHVFNICRRPTRQRSGAFS